MDRLCSAINLEIQEGFNYLSLPNYVYFLELTLGLSTVQAKRQASTDFRLLHQGLIKGEFASSSPTFYFKR